MKRAVAAVVFVAECPLPSCSWTSDPLPSIAVATEAMRGHVSGHSHGALTDFVTTDADAWISRFERIPAFGHPAGKEVQP